MALAAADLRLGFLSCSQDSISCRLDSNAATGCFLTHFFMNRTPMMMRYTTTMDSLAKLSTAAAVSQPLRTLTSSRICLCCLLVTLASAAMSAIICEE